MGICVIGQVSLGAGTFGSLSFISFQLTFDGNEQSASRALCKDAAMAVESSLLRCVIVENGKTIRSMGARKKPTFWSVMERVYWWGGEFHFSLLSPS